MSSSPVCTCGVCPAHGPAGQGAEHPDGGAEWAGPVRRYLESVVGGWTGRRRWVPGTVNWKPGSRSTRGS